MSESTHSYNSDLDAVIREVKEELKTIFFKRKDLILKLGEAFKNVVSDNESICEEIKNALRDEIREGQISERDIERHCLDEWKKKTKPKKPKNDKLSFSQQEQEVVPRVLVDAYGNSEVESAATSDADPNNNVVNYEADSKIDDLNTNTSHVDKDLEEEIKKSTSFTTADQQLSEQGTVIEPKLEASPNDQEDKSFDVQFQYLFDSLQQHQTI